MPKGFNSTIDFDRTYHSKFDGDYVILKEVKSNTKGSREVLIKWIDTGNTQVVPLQPAIHEALRDKTKRQINFDKVYQSRSFGLFKILSRAERNGKSNHIMVNIQFINTGTITTVRYCDVLEGNVRDDYMPHVCRVGCIGKASSYHPAYYMWNAMLSRCYNENDINYFRYGGKGVTVCDRWKCFEYFLEDLPLMDGYNDWSNNPGLYQLDKDLKQIGKPYNEKVYSLETCCFIPNYDNSRIASFEHSNRCDSLSKFIGVQKLPNGKFRSAICVDGVKHGLGVFETEEEAAFAHNAECIKNNRIVLNKLNMCKITNPNKL